MFMIVVHAGHAAHAEVFYAKAGTARVIDAATGLPVGGVNVEASWAITNFRHPDAPPVGELTHAAAETNADGEFAFPAWGPITVDLNSHLRSVVKVVDPSQPWLSLSKPGYRSSVEKGPPDDPRPFWNRFRFSGEDWRDVWWKQRTFKLEPMPASDVKG
ncbi:MAG TPA: hypothetical protein VGH59_16820 [Casimicrobiaceae bacterium]